MEIVFWDVTKVKSCFETSVELFILALGFFLLGHPIRTRVFQKNQTPKFGRSRCFLVSYNEVLEPNWVTIPFEYCKKPTEKGSVFVQTLKTYSDAADYYNNPWDRGHLAPAGSFTTYSNPYATFPISILPSKDQLNRGLGPN